MCMLTTKVHIMYRRLHTLYLQPPKPACDPAGEDFDTVDGVAVLDFAAEDGGPDLVPTPGEVVCCSFKTSIALIASASCFWRSCTCSDSCKPWAKLAMPGKALKISNRLNYLPPYDCITRSKYYMHHVCMVDTWSSRSLANTCPRYVQHLDAFMQPHFLYSRTCRLTMYQFASDGLELHCSITANSILKPHHTAPVK